MEKVLPFADVNLLLSEVPEGFQSISVELRRWLQEVTIEFAGGAIGFRRLDGVSFQSSQRWLHIVFPGVQGGPYEHFDVKFSRQELVPGLGVAQDFHFPLPAAFAHFLNYFNGARLFAGGLVLLGLEGEDRYKSSTSADHEPPPLSWDNTSFRPASLHRKYVLLGHYLHSRFNLCWDSEADVICAIQEDSTEPVAMWSTFYSFCQLEIPRISRLFPAKLDSLRALPLIAPL